MSVASLLLTVAAVAAGFGVTVYTSSSAALGYALENVVDTVGSALVLWRFEGGGATISEASLELREKRAGVGIAAMFVFLGFVVSTNATVALASRHSTENRAALLGLALPSSVIFGALGFAKREVAIGVDSPALMKDAYCSLAGAILSLGVLLSFLLESTAGIWWGDGLVAITVGASLSIYGASALHRNRRLKWWTATFWSEGRSRAELKKRASATLSDFGPPSNVELT